MEPSPEVIEPRPDGRRWRTARWALIAVAGLVTLLAILWTEENWRGRRDWEKYKKEWEAKGEKFDWQDFVSSQVPDDQNFAMAPVFTQMAESQGKTAPEKSGGPSTSRPATGLRPEIYRLSGNGSAPSMGNWQATKATDLKAWQKYYRTPPPGKTNEYPAAPQAESPAADVLLALSKFEHVREGLRQASRRPESRLPISDVNHYQAANDILDYMVKFRICAQYLELHAIAELSNGHSDVALEDVQLSLHLANALRGEPFIITQMVRVALLNVSLQPIWEGLAAHQWTDAQLEELQKSLASIDLLQDYGRMIRSERAFSNEVIAQYIAGRMTGPENAQTRSIRLMPRGLLYQNQIQLNRLHQQVSLVAVDATQHLVFPDRCETNALSAALGKPNPFNIFARMLFPAIEKTVEHTAATQAALDLAGVACAMERYRLGHGQYPETIDSLLPGFAAQIPHDLIGGRPLKFQRLKKGQIRLYSIGWNQVDDGGVVVLRESGTADPERGDWVWEYPPAGEPRAATPTGKAD